MLEANNATAALSVEQKRQSVYASLLQFAPEAGELRLRALERLVMGALLGSERSEPFRVGRIAENLRLGAASTEIRVEIIQETLARLIAKGKVEQTEVRKRHAYYLLPLGTEELSRSIESIETLFRSVLRRVLRDTAHLFPEPVGGGVLRRFISECFARFGRRIARVVIGQATPEDMVPEEAARSAFASACTEVQLTREARESLQQRCFGFLRSTHVDDEKLKFYLTQGYYFTQLLGLDHLAFNPLAEDAFAGAVLYLDSNILIPRLLSEELAARYDELFRQARRIGIELVVTRATINEIRRVAADREPLIARIVDKLPNEMVERTDDSFLNAFLEARGRQPNLGLREFMARFDDLARVLQGELQLRIDERIEDDLLLGKDLAHAIAVVQEESKSLRQREKSLDILRHDLAHYMLTLEERRERPKTWFLTRDRSLVRAGIRLASTEPPFSFGLIPFLQSISPFLTSAQDESALADVFSAFLGEQFFPAETLFDIQELNLIAEMHQDVLMTPQEQLVQAVDYVKRAVLHGQPYRREDVGRFSLGLKSFLASSADERHRALRAEADRLEQETQRKSDELAGERRHRYSAESRTAELAAEVEALREQLTDLEEATVVKDRQLSTVQEQFARDLKWRALRQMIGGFVAGAAVWVFCERIVAMAVSQFEGVNQQVLRTAVGVMGILMFVAPVFRFLRQTSWSDEQKVGFLGAVIAIGLGFSRMLSESTWASWSAYIQVGVFASALLFYFGKRFLRRD